MDLHSMEILARLFGVALGLALIPAIATSRPRKPRSRYLWPALIITSSAIILLDGYNTATQAQRVAIADGTYHITSITDDWLHLDTGVAFGIGVHKSDLVATHDSKDNVVVIKDGRPTAYVRSSQTSYTGDEFSLLAESRPTSRVSWVCARSSSTASELTKAKQSSLSMVTT